MSIPFLVISILGAVVFFFWERALGFAHIAVGAWLMYLTVAAALNFSRGFDLPL